MRYLRLLLAALLVLALASCSKKSTGSGEAVKPALPGSYTLVGDVGGTQVKSDSTVTLTLNADGTLSLKAVRPGEELTDTGTWSVTGDQMKISFKDQGITGEGQFTDDGTTLVLPVLMFGEGKGTSKWSRLGAPVPTGSASSSAAPAAADWDAWDLDKDAAAAATKAYADSRAKGSDKQAALAEANAAAKQNAEVAETEVTGRNIAIRYKDGSVDYVVTERLQRDEAAVSKWAAGAAQTACTTLPSAPVRDEPGREGVNPQGGFGVTVYLPSEQPTPLTSADTPAAKRALLISPQYDVPHNTDGSTETIRNISGDNIECIQGSLTKAGYGVDTVLGRMESGKPAGTGDQAVEALTKFLTANKYGVVYFHGHGFTVNSRLPWGDTFSAFSMGFIDRERPEIKSVINGRKLDKDVNNEIAEALTKLYGLTWDEDDPAVYVGKDVNGHSVLWLRPPYFTQLRGKGVSFDSAMVVFNSCSSSANTSLSDAVAAKAFFGWKNAMGGTFISKAAEAVFDVLTDKVRTARAGWQLWQLHELWVVRGEGGSRDPNLDPRALVALGTKGTPYPPITGSAHVLIFYMRHGPASAGNDLAKSTLVVKACYEQIWSKNLGALASPQCNALKLGGDTPEKTDVDDALFEVGRGTPLPFGRWTLAD